MARIVHTVALSREGRFHQGCGKANRTALPGIGDAYSNKIIEHRPYNRKVALVQKTIIPQATCDKIKDQIVARQT
jgi:hypothetical protein